MLWRCDYFTRAAFSGGNAGGEVTGRLFCVVRQFFVTKFLTTCYKDAGDDVNAQNVCQLILYQLVKREKALQDEEEQAQKTSTPVAKPALKRKQSSGGSRKKPPKTNKSTKK